MNTFTNWQTHEKNLDCHLKTKTKAPFQFRNHPLFTALFMRNFVVCLRFIFLLPLFKIFCQKSVYETTEKRWKEGSKKRMAQNWELKYNTRENKDFRSLARYDFQSKLPKNWMFQSIMTRLWKWLPKVCYLRVLPNDTPNFSYKQSCFAVVFGTYISDFCPFDR